MSKTILHILNGDGMVRGFRESKIEGDYVVWKEALMTGPTPIGLTTQQWEEMRAEYLSSAYKEDKAICKKELVQQREKLKDFSSYEEVVLWFEADLFCQINFLYLINWFANQTLGKTKISMVYGDKFSRRDIRGLGEVAGDEMRSLFNGRNYLETKEFDIAQNAWQAYSSSNPKDMEECLIQQDEGILVFIKMALENHLKRFPSIKNGLGYIENQVLELIGKDTRDFANLFIKFNKTDNEFGLGDLQLWMELERLALGKEPLILMSSNSNNLIEQMRNTMLRITPKGEAVLRGEINFLKECEEEFWLGGVCLSSNNKWYWDEVNKQLVQ